MKDKPKSVIHVIAVKGSLVDCVANVCSSIFHSLLSCVKLLAESGRCYLFIKTDRTRKSGSKTEVHTHVAAYVDRVDRNLTS